MKKEKLTGAKIRGLVDRIAETYKGDCGINFIDASNLPVRGEILDTLELLFEVLFPGHTGKRAVTKANIKFILGDILCEIYNSLSAQIERAYEYQCRIKECADCDCQTKARNVAQHLLARLPKIRELLKADVQAAFEGDPAAKSYEEIVISYPGIVAIATYRIAHELFLEKVPLIPRIMSECAHAKVGIDIHPGAKIGKRFFIDHGTGVVIGETTVIGDNVKIYQGVTLGAMSFPKDERGRIIKSGKRHPTIDDNVTIYAEATILGDIRIGKDAVIGGNVWVKEPVPPGVKVSTANPDLLYTKQVDQVLGTARTKRRKPKT